MARLTEQEQQDIIRYIEADKPLPDKYRFLLFEDKREVELVWNGKTNEVCNIVLPFQTIEQVDEPRAEKPEDTARQADLFAIDARGRQLKGWTNKLRRTVSGKPDISRNFLRLGITVLRLRSYWLASQTPWNTTVDAGVRPPVVSRWLTTPAARSPSSP